MPSGSCERARTARSDTALVGRHKRSTAYLSEKYSLQCPRGPQAPTVRKPYDSTVLRKLGRTSRGAVRGACGPIS
jgi:hypothetical protein